MKNIVIVGSCLSQITVESLEKIGEYKKTYHSMHLRTDILLALLKGNNKIFLNHHELELALKSQKVDLKKNSARIKFQSLEYLEGLKDSLQKADIIVMDLNYDLSRKGYSFIDSTQASIPYIFNFQELMSDGDYQNIIPDEIICKDRELLNAHKSVENLKEIVDLLRAINKDVEICIINYPHTGFEVRNSMARVKSSKALGNLIENSLSEQVHIIPLIDIKEEFLSDKGALYFDEKVYRTFAEYIENVLNENNDSTKILDRIIK